MVGADVSRSGPGEGTGLRPTLLLFVRPASGLSVVPRASTVFGFAGVDGEGDAVSADAGDRRVLPCASPIAVKGAPREAVPAEEVLMSSVSSQPSLCSSPPRSFCLRV